MNLGIIVFTAMLAGAFEWFGMNYDSNALYFAAALLFLLPGLVVLINLEQLEIPRIRSLDLRRLHPVRRMRLREYLREDETFKYGRDAEGYGWLQSQE